MRLLEFVDCYKRTAKQAPEGNEMQGVHCLAKKVNRQGVEEYRMARNFLFMRCIRNN
jgi:hypothetical protein